jgi:hypothetical protein
MRRATASPSSASSCSSASVSPIWRRSTCAAATTCGIPVARELGRAARTQDQKSAGQQLVEPAVDAVRGRHVAPPHVGAKALALDLRPPARVRALLNFLKGWIDARLDDVANGRVADPEKTIAWYWLKNAGNGEHFSKKDVVFECFHNFVAFSQWGNTIFGIMSRLNQDGGDPDVRASFERTMGSDYDDANGGPWTPLELFVMELFRTISPNGASISAIADQRQANGSDKYGDGESPFLRFGLPYERHSF